MRKTALLRRGIALLTLTCFLGLPAESLVADVHDAPLHEEGLREGPGPLAACLDSGAAATPSMATCQSPTTSADHTTHVDHCAHGHGHPLPVMPDVLPESPGFEFAANLETASLSPSSIQPTQRPPKA